MAKKLWELKQAVEPSTLEMYVYGDVEGDGYDWWNDVDIVSETSANHFREELGKYPNATQINIYINSYGGSVFEGTAIYNQLKRHAAQKVVHIDGFACSIASIIAMAGDKIIMPRNAMMMIHNMWNCVCGNSTQLRKAADDLDVIGAGNRQAYLEKSNGKIEESKLIELLDKESWLTAQQCFDYGFCDEISGQDVDLTEAKQMLQKMNKTLEQQLSYNKALAAQLKEIIAEPVQKKSVELPKEPEQQVPQKNKNKKLMEALFHKKGE
jgi:ATP-dependent protease ClpP protease subunit